MSDLPVAFKELVDLVDERLRAVRVEHRHRWLVLVSPATIE
jgi:hypothetical protein